MQQRVTGRMGDGDTLKYGMNRGLKLKLLSRQDIDLILPLGLFGSHMEGKDTCLIEEYIKQ